MKAEKILVCVGHSPASAGVIEAARQKADDMEARLYAVHVESGGTSLLSKSKRDHSADNLRFAEQLGAETIILSGRNIADEIVKFGLERNISRIVAGKPMRSRLQSIFLGSPVDELTRKSGKIPVEVVEGYAKEPAQMPYRVKPRQVRWSDYGTGLLYVILATGLCFLMYPYFDLSNLIMVYLLAVMIASIDAGRGAGILASASSVLAFDFFFVPPRFTFRVDDAQYIVTFAVMFLVSFAISQLTELMRRQAESARLQERQATAMHGLSGQLAGSRTVEKTLRIAVDYLSEIFDSSVLVLLPDQNELRTAAGNISEVLQQDLTKELALAKQAFTTAATVGLGTKVGTGSRLLYVPLQVGDSVLGVIALRPGDADRLTKPDQRRLLESLAKQIALSLELDYLAESGIDILVSHAYRQNANSSSDAVVES